MGKIYREVTQEEFDRAKQVKEIAGSDSTRVALENFRNQHANWLGITWPALYQVIGPKRAMAYQKLGLTPDQVIEYLDPMSVLQVVNRKKAEEEPTIKKPVEVKSVTPTVKKKVVPEEYRLGLAKVENGQTYYTFDGYSPDDIAKSIANVTGNVKTDNAYYIEEPKPKSPINQQSVKDVQKVTPSVDSQPAVQTAKKAEKKAELVIINSKTEKPEKVNNPNAEAYVYGYPRRKVNLYRISPEVAAAVLKSLLQTAKVIQEEPSVVFLNKQLNIPEGELNDTIYHSITIGRMPKFSGVDPNGKVDDAYLAGIPKWKTTDDKAIYDNVYDLITPDQTLMKYYIPLGDSVFYINPNLHSVSYHPIQTNKTGKNYAVKHRYNSAYQDGVYLKHDKPGSYKKIIYGFDSKHEDPVKIGTFTNEYFPSWGVGNTGNSRMLYEALEMHEPPKVKKKNFLQRIFKRSLGGNIEMNILQKKIEQLLKYAEGGEIRKLLQGANMNDSWKRRMAQIEAESDEAEALRNLQQTEIGAANIPNTEQMLDIGLSDQVSVGDSTSGLLTNANTSTINAGDAENKGKKGIGGGGANVPWGMIGDVAIGLNNAIDDAAMGDKNFSTSSKALDQGVDAAASMASKFGPWGLLAAGIMKTLNSASKYGGQNVLGYDVSIENSGYGTMGHMESEAGRVWDKWSGATARKLAKRNEQARMALAAMDISEDTKYEQEARTNSVTNVLQQNQIALAGGIDTSLLGS